MLISKILIDIMVEDVHKINILMENGETFLLQKEIRETSTTWQCNRVSTSFRENKLKFPVKSLITNNPYGKTECLDIFSKVFEL